MKYIDLRSDTVTWPTQEMREAMARAELGDDVYQDDPTMNELTSRAARMVGKEAALFVPSGTFGNQLSLFTWCPRGSEVILGEQCHIIQHEAGAASVIAGVQTRPIPAPDGIIPLAEIESRIRGDDIHFPPTSLVCLETAHSSGRVLPLQYMKEVASLARSRGLRVHLDGARLFNAATALAAREPGADVTGMAARIASCADSVMFCLSKGLCAPVGSIVAGPADFVERARRKRKVMGGGLRQAGVLAAAGLIALDKMVTRLQEDHDNALYLASLLAEIPGIKVDTSALDINMVFFAAPSLDAQALCRHMADNGVMISGPEGGLYRFVTHYWISKDHIDKVVGLMGEFASKQSGRQG
ncbi:MAG: low-specificity L-threonine aldolase [Spirochaetaceae bacterium]|nr:low-specificity L-threonine aldolase [Spirochaetaceae bacterium]